MVDDKEIIVYSTTACPWCHRLKSFLKENGIRFIEKNVQEDDVALKEMIDKTGGSTSVPVTDLKGTIIIGFDEAKLRELLGLN